MLTMMNRDHGPNGPPGPPPHRYPPPHGQLSSGMPHGDVRSPAVVSRPGTGPVPGPSAAGPLERAIAAARYPCAASSASQVCAVGSDPNAAAKIPAPASAASTTASSSSASKPRYKKRTKKYNNFNIFFMLERQLLLQSRGGGIDAVENPIDTSGSPLVRYKELHLPPLCRRYNHLPLTSNWFLELLANQNKKRPHRKSHGLIPFKELAQTVAKNYREIDDETQSFVNEVAERLGWHCEEMEAIETKERREQEVKDRAMGVRAAGGKKRKDAPVVSVAGAKAAAGLKPGLSQDEAATVEQLMGMKTNSPPSVPHPLGQARDFHQAHLAAHMHPHMALHPPHTHSQTFPPARHPMMNPGVPDIESEHLRLELARAMNARRDSEQRIHLLKEQMTLHNARAQQDQHRAAAAHAADRYLASLLGPAGSGPPLSPSQARPHEHMRDSRSPRSLQDVEKALLKEAMARRLIPHGAPMDSLYHGQPPPHHAAARAEAPLPSARSSSAPLKKRQRFGFERPENDAKMSNEAGDMARNRSSSYDDGSVARAASSENRPASAGADELGYYKNLYASLVGRGHPPRAQARPDEALLDGLAHTLGGQGGIDRALLEGLARRGGLGPPSPRMPPARYPPAPQAHGPEYAALLSRLAAGRRPHPSDAASARDGASSPSRRGLLEMVHAAAGQSQLSQLGLNHDDILNVWKQMNWDGEGGARGEGDGARSDRKSSPREEDRA